MVFVSYAGSAGVILIRFPGGARRTLVQIVRWLVQEEGKRLLGAFVVVQPGHIRISRMPVAETWEDV